MGRDGHSLRPPLILRTVLIYLGKDNGQSDPLLGANVFHRHIHLQNRSHRLQIDIPRIYYYGIRTALDRQIYRERTFLRIDHDITFHGHSGLWEIRTLTFNTAGGSVSQPVPVLKGFYGD